MLKTSTLAINGGSPAISPDFAFPTWPPIDEADEQLVLASLRQNSHASGPHVKMLSEEFAAWNGNTFALPTCAGTAALHMCVAGCGVEAGDEVITTALSWTSSATCIIHHNAIPVFVDVNWEDMLLDPAKVEAAITPRTKAILVVHYFGVACDMDPILDIAKRHNLKVIEDACQAHGATDKGRRVGTMGDAGAFSFNQNKNLCGGEGGMFVTNDEAIFKRGRAVSAFSDMRPADSGRDYDDYGLGWMYRTSDLPAAFALSQLRKLDHTNQWARDNFLKLAQRLDGTPHLLPSFTTDDRPSNGYSYVLRTDPAYAKQRGVAMRDVTVAVIEAIKAEGLRVSSANWMLPAHAVFQAKNAYGKGSPWTDGHTTNDVSYDLAQYPVTQQCVDTCMWNINAHRPPCNDQHLDAFAAAVRKVYDNLDEVPIKSD